ncbi:hypothetical protein OAB57_01520 [Bacteriovoracaceae bacterium]|nr:hypothetical protein [Bacteriovoracaceae bacterium]
MKTAANKKFRSINITITLYMLAFTLCATILSTIFQIIQEYNRNIQQLNVQIEGIEKSYLKSLGATLWDVDENKIKLQLTGILALPGIEKVAILGQNKNDTFSMGSSLSKDIIEKSFLITHISSNNKTHNLGTLVVTAGLEKLMIRIKNMGVRIFVIQMIQTFIFYFFIFILFDALVTKHLKKLVNFANELNIQNPGSKILDFDRDETYNDEFSLLVNAINGMGNKLSLYTQNLQSGIEEKTKDIRSILNTIRLGIFTITPNNKIHPEYSKYLEEILDTKDIANRDVIDILFKNTDLLPEQLSDLLGTLVSCLGENIQIYKNNEKKLVSIIRRTNPNGKTKVLEIYWRPVIHNNIVEKIIVTIRDITKLDDLQTDTYKKQHILEIIAELLTVNPLKFNRFLLNSLKIISECQYSIRPHDERDDKILQKILLSLHTINIQAKTLGLFELNKLISSQFKYFDRYQQDPKYKWDQSRIYKKLKNIQLSIEEYQQINENKLGRSTYSYFVGKNIEDPLVQVDPNKALEQLEMIQSIDTYNLTTSQKDTVRKVCRYLTLTGYNRLRDIIAIEVENTKHIAKSYGKQIPKIVFNNNHTYFKHNLHNTIRNVFGHLLRNSVEHGIEKVQNRLNKGKETFGRIDFDIHAGEHQVIIRYKDDGIGLNIQKITESARKNGLLDSSKTYSNEELANFIFTPGVTLRCTEKKISSKDIGLKSTRKFLEEVNGAVKLVLIDAPIKDQGHHPFEIIVTLSLSDIIIDNESLGHTLFS